MRKISAVKQDSPAAPCIRSRHRQPYSEHADAHLAPWLGTTFSTAGTAAAGNQPVSSHHTIGKLVPQSTIRSTHPTENNPRRAGRTPTRSAMRPSFGFTSAALALFLLFAAANTAHACTVCDSAAGRNLRSGLFNGHFIHNL